MANPTFWGSPKAQRVKNSELFWGLFGSFLDRIWAQIESLLRVFSALDLGPFPRNLIWGQKARIFGVFGGFLALNPWALLALANETHPSCVPRHVFRGLGCLG